MDQSKSQTRQVDISGDDEEPSPAEGEVRGGERRGDAGAAS